MTDVAPMRIVPVSLAIPWWPGRKMVVTPVARAGAPVVPPRADSALAQSLARAFRCQGLLDEGRYASIGEISGPGL